MNDHSFYERSFTFIGNFVKNFQKSMFEQNSSVEDYRKICHKVKI